MRGTWNGSRSFFRVRVRVRVRVEEVTKRPPPFISFGVHAGLLKRELASHSPPATTEDSRKSPFSSLTFTPLIQDIKKSMRAPAHVAGPDLDCESAIPGLYTAIDLEPDTTRRVRPVEAWNACGCRAGMALGLTCRSRRYAGRVGDGETISLLESQTCTGPHSPHSPHSPHRRSPETFHDHRPKLPP